MRPCAVSSSRIREAWTTHSPASFSGLHPHRRGSRVRGGRRRRVRVAWASRAAPMDEQEFRRMLDLFPVVRSSDYCADPGTSGRGTTQQARAQEPTKSNKKDSSGAEDIFMQKLRLAAEKKIGATKAEFFCKAFEEAHEKLVYKELNLDAAEKFLNAKKFQ